MVKLSISLRFCFRLQPFPAKRWWTAICTFIWMELLSFALLILAAASEEVQDSSTGVVFVSQGFDDFQMLGVWFEMFDLSRTSQKAARKNCNWVPRNTESLLVSLACFSGGFLFQDLQNSSNGPFNSSCSVYQPPSVLVSEVWA